MFHVASAPRGASPTRRSGSSDRRGVRRADPGGADQWIEEVDTATAASPNSGAANKRSFMVIPLAW